jgi:putative nucleotidyltransferase with HDIG domain
MTGKALPNTLISKPPLSLDMVVRQVTEISTLPQVALRVIEVARNPDSGAADLKAVVEGDPALSVRVLRMVNSAACGLRSTVTNLHQAISYLGFSQVRNLAMTASVSEIFKDEIDGGTYRRRGLWRHLVSVGVCARLIASRCRLANFEDAFLAGLLHDIGIILEDQGAHARFREMLGALREGTPLCVSEQTWLGFDHCALGARFAEAWKFPPTVWAAIRFHHATAQYTGEGAEIVHCVEIANVICTIKGIMAVGLNLLEPPRDALRALALQKEDIVILAKDLDRELAMHENLFEL